MANSDDSCSPDVLCPVWELAKGALLKSAKQLFCNSPDYCDLYFPDSLDGRCLWLCPFANNVVCLCIRGVSLPPECGGCYHYDVKVLEKLISILHARLGSELG